MKSRTASPTLTPPAPATATIPTPPIAPVTSAAPATTGPALTGKVPLLDVNRNNAPIRDEIVAAVTKVIDSGRFLFGPEVTEFENNVAKLSGTKHAIGCASGSDALLLALQALSIGEGDEVILPSFTFFATASAAWRLGAEPVFVDIDHDSFNIDPARIEEAITPRTRAIIPVHLFGQCADMQPILDLAKRKNLWVIEDAAQAIGASYGDRPAGSMGIAGCLSFYPTKNLGGLGDGGMLTTNDATVAERLRLFAAHGMNPRYYHRVVGINSRLDTIQAAALGVKLTRLAQWTSDRATHAARYDDLLKEAGLDQHLELPKQTVPGTHVWNQYTVRVKGQRRDSLKAGLAAAGVGSEVYYPVPLHQQECFASLRYASGSLPETEAAAREVLSLPVFPEMTIDEQFTVVSHLARLLQRPARHAA